MVKCLLAPAIFSAVLLYGCDGGPQALSDLFHSPTGAQVYQRVLELERSGKPAEALQVGEAFLLKNADPQAKLHQTLARIYTEAGDTQNAVHHLQQSHGRDIVGSTPMATHAPAPAVAAAPEPVSPPTVSIVSTEAGGASAWAGAAGTQASASASVAFSSTP